MTAKLFTPFDLGGITLPNRIVVSPMCQYSAADGAMTDWHLVHLGGMAGSGAGLVILEATGVVREGRITHGCAGLYSDVDEAAMKRVVDACRVITRAPIGVQLAHAGRKASAQVPWAGGRALGVGESPWPTVAPSALAYDEGWHTPHELSVEEIGALVDAFAAAAERARRIGLDLVEMHSAHGYLLHQFLSPLCNRRTDAYGGSLDNRLRFPLAVARALREAWPRERALGARITASDWAPGGFEVEDAAVYAAALKAIGFDYVCVSSGGAVPQQRIRVEPGYQAGFAARVREATGLPVMAVGMIVDPQAAEDLVSSGRADLVALARGLLDDPHWPWHAAERLGADIEVPPQYRRALHHLWPGAAIARPPRGG